MPGLAHANVASFTNTKIVNKWPLYNFPTGGAIAPGDKITVKGQMIENGDMPVGNLNVTGYFIEDPTPKIISHAVTDKNGNFEIEFQTWPQMKVNKGCEITLYANYDGFTSTWKQDEIRTGDIKRFTFFEDGKNSTSTIISQYGLPVYSFTLDKDTKTLTFVGNVTDTRGYYTIMVPSDLLSGNMTIRNDKNQSVLVTPERFTGGGYGISGAMNNGTAIIYYQTNNLGPIKLEITGTTVIPEFPYAMPILLVSIVSMIIFYRIKFK